MALGGVPPVSAERSGQQQPSNATTPAPPAPAAPSFKKPSMNGPTAPFSPSSAWTRAFGMLWLAQFIVLFWTEILGLGFRVWLYQRTGSQAHFITIVLISEGAGLLLMPFAGMVADRFHRKRVMIGSNLLLSMFCLFVYSTSRMRTEDDALDITDIYFFCTFTCSIITSACTLEQLTFAAVVASLAPTKQHLGHLAGAVQVGATTASMLAPMVTAGALAVVPCEQLLFLEGIVLFVAAVLIYITPLPPDEMFPPKEQRATLRDIGFSAALEFLRERKPLRLMVGTAVANGFVIGLSQTLLQMLMMAFPRGHYAQGVLLTFTSAAAVLGSLIMTWWGGSKHRPATALVWSPLIRGGLIALCGWMWWGPPTLITSPTIPTCVLATLSAMVAPMGKATAEAFLQRKMPFHLRGRVFVFAGVFWRAAGLFGMIAAGPLAESLFEPWFLQPPAWSFGGKGESGAWAITHWFLDKMVRWTNTWIGFGVGKGVSVLLVIVGLFQMAMTLFTARRLLRLDDEVPDILLPAEAEELRKAALKAEQEEKKQRQRMVATRILDNMQRKEVQQQQSSQSRQALVQSESRLLRRTSSASITRPFLNAPIS